MARPRTSRDKNEADFLANNYRLLCPGSLSLPYWAEAIRRLILSCLLLLVVGCATAPIGRYREEHDIQVKVVYLDKESLHEEYEGLSMLPAVVGRRGVRAFFDPETNTLYCQKWDFEYCGHELHHATNGAWHSLDQ